MKSNNIFLLGDFNCDLLGVKERTEVIDNNLKTRNGYWIYRWFSRYVIATMLVDGKQKIAH